MKNIESQILKHTTEFVKNSICLLKSNSDINKFSEMIGKTASLYGKYKVENNIEKMKEIKAHLDAQLSSLDTIKTMQQSEIAKKILKNAIMAGINLAINITITQLGDN